MGFHHVPTVCGCQFPGILPVVASLPSGGTRSDGRVMLRLQPSCKSVKSGGTTLQIYINSWISASFLPIKRCILVAFRDFCFFEESKCFVCRCGPSRFITSFSSWKVVSKVSCPGKLYPFSVGRDCLVIVSRFFTVRVCLPMCCRRLSGSSWRMPPRFCG